MVIVDSSVWIDYLNDTVNPQTAWLEDALGQRAIGITNLILCEVLQGVRHERRFQLAERLLLTLPVFDIAGTRVAISAARNYHTLQSRGITIRRTIDCLIATFCIMENCELLHRDRDFDPFEQHLRLKVVKT
ncbi:MAG: PIN domain nuclease [Acidobacteriota bacterium]|jgi:predicted nucleic acid-binding protein